MPKRSVRTIDKHLINQSFAGVAQEQRFCNALGGVPARTALFECVGESGFAYRLPLAPLMACPKQFGSKVGSKENPPASRVPKRSPSAGCATWACAVCLDFMEGQPGADVRPDFGWDKKPSDGMAAARATTLTWLSETIMFVIRHHWMIGLGCGVCRMVRGVGSH